jgi:hypothetical protein
MFARALDARHFTTSAVERRFFQPSNPRYAIPRGNSDPTVLLWLRSNDHDHIAISRIVSSCSPTLDHSKSRVSEMLRDYHASCADGRFRILRDFQDVVESTLLPMQRLRLTVNKAPTDPWIYGPGSHRYLRRLRGSRC